jgi:hypothetical protein
MTTPWDKQHNQQKRWRVEPIDSISELWATDSSTDYLDWYIVAKKSAHTGAVSVQFVPRKTPLRDEYQPRWKTDESYPWTTRELEVA